MMDAKFWHPTYIPMFPSLTDNFTIWIELPNGTMKKEIEREKYDLMEYLKLKLNNHFIQLRITVNEATAKKFAFTPEEKYHKIKGEKSGHRSFDAKSSI